MRFRLKLIIFCLLFSGSLLGLLCSVGNRKIASLSSTSTLNEVSLLIDRQKASIMRENIILNENKELCVSTYLFQLDEFGRREVGLLVDAARRGVKVTLVVDGVGKNRGANSDLFVRSKELLSVLEREGIDVKIYNPKFRNFRQINNRNHIKVLIGSNSMIIGDRNYALDYFKRKNSKNYISTELLIKGSLVSEAINSFKALLKLPGTVAPYTPFVRKKDIDRVQVEVDKWREVSIRERRTVRTLLSYKVDLIEYVDDSLGFLLRGEHSVHKKLLDMIKSAREMIDIVNPYILLTSEFRGAIVNAIKRGVHVRIITNSRETNNIRIMGEAWAQGRGELLDLGVDIYELEGKNFLHAKSLVVDRTKAYIGSFNLDPRSQNLNLENGVIITDKTLSENLIKHNNRIARKLSSKFSRIVPEKSNFCYKAMIKLLSPLL